MVKFMTNGADVCVEQPITDASIINFMTNILASVSTAMAGLANNAEA